MSSLLEKMRKNSSEFKKKTISICVRIDLIEYLKENDINISAYIEALIVADVENTEEFKEYLKTWE